MVKTRQSQQYPMSSAIHDDVEEEFERIRSYKALCTQELYP
jgi:hypothetical protein